METIERKVMRPETKPHALSARGHHFIEENLCVLLRFYSKFHKKRMEELSEQGILSFFNLFLTLASLGELEDVVC
jgi:hypothetical protein